MTIEPFDLRAKPRHDLVIDRLAYWYYHPREWLKKAALTDDVYLLNSPFTFQSMEKHAAYCAMMRLGLHVPDTVLVPYKNPPEHAKYAYTAEQYNRPFDLDAIADQLGYPIFMKPYDGGAWVGVSQIRNSAELHRAYDESGQRLMHLQKAVAGFDVFARSLSIGAETMVMNFDPDQPMHARYSVSHDFLDAETGHETVTIGRLVNAFFRWEFNSCETLIKDGVVYPIDYANACPDVAITSLHYYFPWAMKALVKWSVFCTTTGRRPRYDLDTRRYFDIADRDDLELRRQARRVPHAGRRLLRGRALQRLLREPPRPSGRGRARVLRRARIRRLPGRHRPLDVPGARARPLHRALPRAARRLGLGRSRPDRVASRQLDHPGGQMRGRRLLGAAAVAVAAAWTSRGAGPRSRAVGTERPSQH